MSNRPYLILSNGHGEDLIGARIIRGLREFSSECKIAAFPLVGKGKEYLQAKKRLSDLRFIDEPCLMPSAGFGFLSLRWLIRDMRRGLIPAIIRQIGRLISESRRTRYNVVAVGDLYPLILAWLSGSEFIYFNAKKSSYMFSEQNQQRLRDWLPRLRNTNWNFLELLLIKSKRCVAVITRDDLTSESLRDRGIKSYAANLMFDGFDPIVRSSFKSRPYIPVVLCMPGSRHQEYGFNCKKIMETIEEFNAINNDPCLFLFAASSENALDNFKLIAARNLSSEKIQLVQVESDAELEEVLSSNPLSGLTFVGFGHGKFKKWVNYADACISMAGTASEQAAFMGIPIISIPGEGPQYTRRFAERQHRLLGDCLKLDISPKLAARSLFDLLQDKSLRERLGAIGSARVGSAKSNRYVAEIVLDSFSD